MTTKSLIFALESKQSKRGIEIAVRLKIAFCNKVVNANIQLFLPRCAFASKYLSKIKDYD